MAHFWVPSWERTQTAKTKVLKDEFIPRFFGYMKQMDLSRFI
jgi:hypothetical protein